MASTSSAHQSPSPSPQTSSPQPVPSDNSILTAVPATAASHETNADENTPLLPQSGEESRSAGVSPQSSYLILALTRLSLILGTLTTLLVAGSWLAESIVALDFYLNSNLDARLRGFFWGV